MRRAPQWGLCCALTRQEVRLWLPQERTPGCASATLLWTLDEKAFLREGREQREGAYGSQLCAVSAGVHFYGKKESARWRVQGGALPLAALRPGTGVCEEVRPDALRRGWGERGDRGGFPMAPVTPFIFARFPSTLPRAFVCLETDLAGGPGS